MRGRWRTRSIEIRLDDPDVVNRSAPHGMPERVTLDMLTIRAMDHDEMSMAFAWMWQDEQDFRTTRTSGGPGRRKGSWLGGRTARAG